MSIGSGSSFEASRKFSGLRSRCTTPSAWQCATTRTMVRVMAAASRSEYCPRSTIESKSSPPEQSSFLSFFEKKREGEESFFAFS